MNSSSESSSSLAPMAPAQRRALVRALKGYGYQQADCEAALEATGDDVDAASRRLVDAAAAPASGAAASDDQDESHGDGAGAGPLAAPALTQATRLVVSTRSAVGPPLSRAHHRRPRARRLPRCSSLRAPCSARP